MPAFNIFMISIVVTSLLLATLILQRIILYNQKYHLPESQYTRLFHVLTKEHVTVLYIIGVLIHAFFGIWFIMTI